MAAITGQKDYVTHPESGLVISHDGFIDMDGIYDGLKEWYGKKKYDYFEKEVQIKNKSQGKEIVFSLMGEREIDEYFKFHVDFRMYAIRCNKVKDGYAGWVRISVFAWVELDWKGKWQKTPFHRLLFYLYNNFVIKDRIQRFYEGKLYREMLEAIAIVKSKLKAYD